MWARMSSGVSGKSSARASLSVVACGLLLISLCSKVATINYYNQGLTDVPYISYGETHADLSYNSITILRNGCFSSATTLETIYLLSNAISSVRQYAFSGLTSLDTLTLGSNQLARMPPIPSDVSSNVRVFSLGMNAIREIPDGYFATWINLVKLILYDNELTMINKSDFQGLAKLALLDISDNKITSIDSECFQSMPDLEQFLARENPMESMPCFSEGLGDKLRIINLNQWNIKSSISDSCLDGLTGVEQLTLTNGQILSIDPIIRQLHGLQELFMRGSIIIIPPSPDLFTNHYNLQHVDMTDAQGLINFPLFPANGRHQLRHLKFARSELNCVDRVHLVGMSQLLTLDLNFTFLSSLSIGGCYQGEFTLPADSSIDFPSLQTLGISGNNFTTNQCLPGLTIDEYRCDLGPYLTTIDASCIPNSTDISFTSDALTDFPDFRLVDTDSGKLKTRTIFFRSNQITTVDRNFFEPLWKLSYLDLSFNQIKFFDISVLSTLPEIDYVDVKNNLMTGFGIAGLEDMTIDATSNPLHCGHQLCWLLDPIQPSLNLLLDSAPCVSPPALANVPIQELTTMTMNCYDTYHRKRFANGDIAFRFVDPLLLSEIRATEVPREGEGLSECALLCLESGTCDVFGHLVEEGGEPMCILNVNVTIAP